MSQGQQHNQQISHQFCLNKKVPKRKETMEENVSHHIQKKQINSTKATKVKSWGKKLALAETKYSEGTRSW